jgi:hypothetical protein
MNEKIKIIKRILFALYLILFGIKKKQTKDNPLGLLLIFLLIDVAHSIDGDYQHNTNQSKFLRKVCVCVCKQSSNRTNRSQKLKV